MRQAMSEFGMNAQQTFVSLVCNKNNIAMGTIHHALGTIRDYSFNSEVALQAILSIKNVSQIWFGRSSPDCMTELSEKDHEYYRWLSENLLNNNIGSRGLIIVTPSGDAKYSDGEYSTKERCLKYAIKIKHIHLIIKRSAFCRLFSNCIKLGRCNSLIWEANI